MKIYEDHIEKGQCCMESKHIEIVVPEFCHFEVFLKSSAKFS
jgi:hypothetical protein